MTLTQVLVRCEEAVATRWSCKDVFEPQIRFFLPDHYPSRGGRVLVHPLSAVACDVTGYGKHSESDGLIMVASSLLDMKREVATLVFDAANGEEPLDPLIRTRVMEIRQELVERIVRQKRASADSYWEALKRRS